MTEGIRNQFVEHEFDIQPFDGLSILRDADFVERWIKSEQQLNDLLDHHSRHCNTYVNSDTDTLNELFRTDQLGGKLVAVSGKILQESDSFEIKNARPITNEQFRFGQIKYIKVMGLVPGRPHTEQYRAAVKLLPLAEQANVKTKTNYMLLQDAESLEFSDTLTSAFNPARIDDTFSEILEDSRSLRTEESYSERTTGEQRGLLDERAREYARRLAPLIDQRVPIMIDAAEFRKFSTKPESHGKIISVDTRDMTRNQQDGNMITGHLTKLAFSNAAIDNVAIAPHLVVENTHAREIYWVPLSTDFDIWTL